MRHGALIASTCAVLAGPLSANTDVPLARAERRASAFTPSAQTDAAGDPSADLDRAAGVDTLDFLLFLNLWTACRG